MDEINKRIPSEGSKQYSLVSIAKNFIKEIELDEVFVLYRDRPDAWTMKKKQSLSGFDMKWKPIILEFWVGILNDLKEL